MRSKLKFCLFFTSEWCTINAYVQPGQTAYKEVDGLPGQTAGDTIIHTGDHLEPYDVVRLTTCRVW